MVQLPTEFRAHLESYRGPLDLLLYLIKRDELDVFDIPIARITEQYLGYLQILRTIDPNVCGDFLVMAAQLMEIKSRTLLPVTRLEEGEEELEDPRLQLVLQLLEYKKYKERALLLEKLVAEHSRKYRRPTQDLADLLDGEGAPLDLGSVSVWDLLTAFQRVQIALGGRQPHRILFEDRPVEEYIKAVREQLETARETAASNGDEGARVLFEDLFAESQDRHDAIGFLLAILEMTKQGVLRFHQETLFGPIYLELVDNPPVADSTGDESIDERMVSETATETAADEPATTPPAAATGPGADRVEPTEGAP